MADDPAVAAGKAIDAAYSRAGSAEVSAAAPLADPQVSAGKAIDDAYRTQDANAPPAKSWQDQYFPAPTQAQLGDIVPPADNPISRILGAGAEGFRTGPPIFGQPTIAQAEQAGPVGYYLNSPLMQVANFPLKALSAAYKGGQATVDEALSPLNPLLGTNFSRDIAALPEAFPFGAEFLRPPGRPPIPEAPPPGPRFMSEITAPPRPPGMTDAARINQLVEHAVNEEQPAVGPPMARGPSTQEPNALLPAPQGGAAAAPIVSGAAAGPAVQLNPAGEAAPTSGPYAPSNPTEITNIPEALPTQRTPILTEGGVNARADAIIQHFAANGPKDMDTSVNIPGSVPTLAQGTGNAGLATLERGMRNQPEAANVFNAVDTAQTQGRQAVARNLVKTTDDLAAAKATRDANTSELRDAAFAPSNITATDASAALTEIDKVLAGPEGGRTAVTGPLQQLRKGFFDADGQPITDPETLYKSTRNNITDALGPLARGTDKDARAASAILQRVLPKLDDAIEAGAPGYQNYMTAFHDQSQPVNSMEYLQGRNLTDASGNTTLQKLDSTIKDVQRQQAMPGARKADSLSDEQMATLEALRTDHLRSANLGKGKALGSNTVQNLATNTTSNLLINPAANIAGRIVGGVGGGLPGYLAAEATSGGLSALQRSMEGRVRQAVIDRLLNKNGLGEAALRGRPQP